MTVIQNISQTAKLFEEPIAKSEIRMSNSLEINQVFHQSSISLINPSPKFIGIGFQFYQYLTRRGWLSDLHRPVSG